MKLPRFHGAKLPRKNLLFQVGKWPRASDLPRFACEGHVCPGASVCRHASVLGLQGPVILHGPHCSSDSHPSGASRTERGKKDSENPNPLSQSPWRCLLCLCHLSSQNSQQLPSLTTRTFLRGSPGAARMPWQQNNVQQGEDRWENPAKQTRGVNGSESKIHLNPLIGNKSKFFRHYIVTIRCKHRISDLRKTESFCSIFVRAEFHPVFWNSHQLPCVNLKVYNLTTWPGLHFEFPVPGQEAERMQGRMWGEGNQRSTESGRGAIFILVVLRGQQTKWAP